MTGWLLVASQGHLVRSSDASRYELVLYVCAIRCVGPFDRDGQILITLRLTPLLNSDHPKFDESGNSESCDTGYPYDVSTNGNELLLTNAFATPVLAGSKDLKSK